MFNRSKRNLKNKKGFTLIELVVVIAVIGILAAIAIPRVTGITSSAKEKATKDHLAILNSAVERYMAESKEGSHVKYDATAKRDIIVNASNAALSGKTEPNAELVIGYLKSGDYLSDDVSIDTLPNGKILLFDGSTTAFSASTTDQSKPGEAGVAK